MKKYIIFAVLLIAGVGTIFTLANKDDDGFEVEAFRASRADILKTVDLSGTIEAVDYEEISLTQGSKVLKVYGVENQKVSKGQLLAELDPGDIPYKLDKLEINREQLKQELSELQKPGKVSDLLSLKNRVAKAEGTYDSIDRKFKDSEEKAAKLEKLYQAGAVSENEYKNQTSARDDLAEQLVQAEIELDNAQNELVDYDHNKKLEIQTKTRQLESNEADIKSLKKQLEDTAIKSSADGILVEFPLKEGRSINSEEVIRIYDMSRLSFKGLLTQEDAVRVKPGQVAEVSLKGLEKTYSAEVSSIKKFAMLDKDSASLTPKIEVQLRLVDIDEALAVGFEADAVIMVEKAESTLSVPREAVGKNTEGQSAVYVVNEGVTASTAVITGISDDYLVEIKSGVSEGDVVVLNPPAELKDGDHVSVNLK